MGELERFLEDEYQRTRAAPAGLPGDRVGLAQWAQAALGRFPASSASRHVGSWPQDGFTRHEVALSGVEGLTFGAFLLVPDGLGPFPGVLAVHGHGWGPGQAVGLGPDGRPEEAPISGHNQFALSLVRQGLVVLVPAVVGFGPRRCEEDWAGDPRTSNSCHRIATQLLLQGKTLAGLRVAEAAAALAWLRHRPEVEGQRTGVVGFSGGALVALWLALAHGATDATVLVGFPNTYHDSILAIHHCVDNYVPGALAAAELPELIGRLAPSPLFLESGDRDPIFPPQGFAKVVDGVSSAYEQVGDRDAFAWDLVPGGHAVSGRRAFPWLGDVLRRP